LPESSKVNAKRDGGVRARFFLKTSGLRATMSRLFFGMTLGNAQAWKLLPGKHYRRREPACFTFA
jgi:hypothetical protein